MIDFEEKLRDAVNMIGQTGEEYAHAKATSWHLQELRKVVLADCLRTAEGKTILERESNARLSENYKQHLEGTKEAIKEELIAKAKNEKWKATYESLRSLCSIEKKKINEFGG